LYSNWIPGRVKRNNLSLADQVYSLLKEAILSLDLLPGMHLVEADLSKSMDTSVTPIREALRRLESQGLVVSTYGRSPRVRGLSLKEVRDSYELRALLESWAVRKSFSYLTDDRIKGLEECMREAETCLSDNNLIGFSRKNRQFHFEICRFCGNDYLLRVLHEIADQQHRVRITLAKHTNSLAKDRSNKAIQDHLAIINAIRARDLDLTVNLVHRDITSLLNDIDAGKLESLDLILNK
jgi:DNA-binding GntR family transcriptional regulator